MGAIIETGSEVMSNLYEEILKFEPFCESEMKDKECMLEALN